MKEFNSLFLRFATPLRNTQVGTIPISQRFLAHGLCFYWGYVFAKLFNGQCITLADLDDHGQITGKSPHMIVKVGNLYYDGEYNLGTSKMPQKKDFHKEVYHKSPEEALEFWDQANYKLQFLKVLNRIKNNMDLEPKKVPLWKQAMEPWKKY